jgi:GntR family transcriptional repressor for pyruvate dehydrogenase complex
MNQRAGQTLNIEDLNSPHVDRLSDLIAEQIQELLVSQNLPVGARLPGERELAERLGTSRPTVNQALRKLALMGLVEIRRGSGVFAIREPQSPITESIKLMLNLAEDSVNHLADLRLSLELWGITKAIENPAGLDTGPAEAALAELRNSTSGVAEWISADTRLHVEIIRLSGNPYLTAVFESVHAVLVSRQYQQWIDEGVTPKWLEMHRVEAQMKLHEPILEAVQHRDLERGRVAILQHHNELVEHLVYDSDSRAGFDAAHPKKR